MSVAADLVPSMVPLLIPKHSLLPMSGKLDSRRSILGIRKGMIIHLRGLPIGHIRAPALPSKIGKQSDAAPARNRVPLGTLPLRIPKMPQPITDAQMLRIHKRLSHCIEFAMTNLLKARGKANSPSDPRAYLSRCRGSDNAAGNICWGGTVRWRNHRN